MCPTYGRSKRVLDECIHSFLKQDYQGEKELLILNDFSNQHLCYEHPEVRIVNTCDRYPSLGDKRNAAVSQSRYDLLAVWDDDDIYLSHRLSYCAARYDPNKRFFKPSRAFVFDDSRVQGPTANLFHGAGIWHRSLFDDVGGYRSIDCGEDLDIELRFEARIDGDKNYDDIDPKDIYYLYRWSGTGSYHTSWFTQNDGRRGAHDSVAAFAAQQIREDRVETGEVALDPQWYLDYASLVEDYVQTLI
jgi:glycosyltransferase involved in cell wall biosynthesis